MSSTSSHRPPAKAVPDADRRARKPRSTRLPRILLAVGTIVALLAVALLGYTLYRMATIQGEALAALNDNTITYRAEFGFIEREMSVLSFLVSIPACMMLVAACFLFPGYQLSRGSYYGRETTFMRGGSNVAVYRPLALWAHALWLLLPLAAWVALIAVPVRSMMAGGWPDGLREEQSTAVWLFLGSYGVIAGGLFATMLASLIKKSFYLAWVWTHPEAAAGGAGQGFWRWMTYRWRFDLWFAGLGGGFLGACWIALAFEDQPFFQATVLIGAALFVVGVALSLNYWRAGEPLGTGESQS
ncbi:hypothetical protein [Cryobacterium zhongshanensis]|uniref:Uncharacterized protein n=1 Tax=Cryobacterium zhongshanensis TaxID=2928153 RepID=A0AA41ULF4_9MICO|nr:hypothetical protein [Cryobacterium zhongshanensis]MCI4658851.1 hypothetical protein [Cryobacterium zhongshanensis]